MGRAGRAGITVSLVAGFPPSSSSLLTPEGPGRRMSLPLVPFFPLVIVKPQGNKDFFFLYPSLGGCVFTADSGGRSATCMASHLLWGHTLPHLSPRTHCVCERLDSNPAFTLTEAAGTRFSTVTAGYWGMAMWWQWWEGLWVHRWACWPNCRCRTNRSPGPRARCFFSSSTPAKLEPSPATQHRNALCAALAHRKIWLIGWVLLRIAMTSHSQGE